MKKNFLKTILLSTLLSVLCLSGCNGTGDSSSNKSTTSSNPIVEKNEYNVSFYVDGTLYGETLTVEAGSKISKPNDPVRVEDDDYTYTFEGWYEAGSSVAWNFGVDVVNKDLDLFANFDEITKVYDLTVWLLGGSTESVFITEEESERLETTFEASIDDGKKVLFKYYPSMKSEAFNASVLSTSKKPDVVVSGSKMNSGDNALTLNETYGRTKVGKGWFASETRYVGILNTCDANLNLAIDFYNMLIAEGPDYFTLDKESITLMVGETTSIIPTLKENDTRKVIYTIGDETIATVEEGLIRAVATGNTILTVTLGLISVEVPIEVIENVDYDLVVWVYGVNGATTPTTYITVDESNRLKEEFLKLDIAQDKEIYWVYSEGYVNADFNNAVVNANPQVDVVFSGNKLDDDDVSILCHETYGKVRVGEGWFENTGRRVTITENCDENLSLAVALYDLARNVGPDYQLSIDKTTLSLKVGATSQLTALAYGGVTWTSSDETIAIVEDGLVTAVKEGTTTITATDKDNNTVECNVTVNAATGGDENKETYDLIVCVYLAAKNSTYITEEEYNAIVSSFEAEGSAGYGKNILWITFSGGNQATLGAFISEKVDEGTTPDVIIGRSGIKSGSVTGLTVDEETYIALDTTWATDGNYVAINSAANPNNTELGKALITMISNAKA